MNPKGFTLIELVMVLVLIGIIAVFVAPRIGNVASMKASALRDKLRADIRYTQNLAMTQNRLYRIYFNAPPAPASGYAAVNDVNGDGWGTTGANEYARDPSTGGSLRVTLDAGDYAGITVSPNTFVEYDSLGRPTVGGGTVLTVSPGAMTVTITTETGAVN